MKKIYEILQNIFTPSNWGSIILSSLVTAFLISIRRINNYLKNSKPGNNVLNIFRNQNVNIFFKYIDNENQSGYRTPFTSVEPNDERERRIDNTKYVIGLADFNAITDILIPITKYGKTKSLNYLAVHLHMGTWEKPYICIGTSQKTIHIYDKKRCNPLDFKIEIREINGEKTSGFTFDNFEGFYHDIEAEKIGHGIIQKTRDVISKVGVFLIMGHGKTGTQTAGFYLKDNIERIGRLYGKKNFMLLVAAENDNPELGYVIYLSPRPNFLKKVIFYKSWTKISKYLHNDKYHR